MNPAEFLLSAPAHVKAFEQEDDDGDDAANHHPTGIEVGDQWVDRAVVPNKYGTDERIAADNERDERMAQRARVRTHVITSLGKKIVVDRPPPLAFWATRVCGGATLPRLRGTQSE